MAIVMSEGYATEACRTLLEHADQQRKYQIFVLHDADPHGYNIARTLRKATERMPDYAVDVVDIGLGFEEGLELGLGTESFTRKQAIIRAGTQRRRTPSLQGSPDRGEELGC